MYDLFTTAAIADELQDQIVDGRVQAVGLASPDTLVLELYTGQRNWLVATINPENPRLYLSKDPIAIDPELKTPFSLLLRKHVRGGMVAVVDQPDLERIVRLTLGKRIDSEDGADQVDHAIAFVTLIVEIMGRHSNVILVDDSGWVVDALKRVPPSKSRARPILPHQPYAAPPVGDRLDPRAVTAEALTARSAADPGSTNVSTLLTKAIRGVSPQAARETLQRSLGTAKVTIEEMDAERWRVVAMGCRDLFEILENRLWQPTIYRDEDEEIAAYAAMPLQHLSEEFCSATNDSMSEIVSISSLRPSSKAGGFKHAGRITRLTNEVDAARQRAIAKLFAIEQGAGTPEDLEKYRRWGEAIYANLHTITPGTSALEWQDEVIPLDSAKPAKDQAEEHFNRYRKLKSAKSLAPERLESASLDVRYLDQLLLQLSQATTFDQYEALLAEWRLRSEVATVVTKKRKPAGGKVMAKPLSDRHGNQLLIGRSGVQNEHVTFTVANPADLWLHARGLPGAHVILRLANNAAGLDDGLIERAASVAAWYSGARQSSRVEVDITARRNVRKIKGSPPGMVTYRNERTLNVVPADESRFQEN